MSKNSCVIYAPVTSQSGYGAHLRTKVKAIIETKKDEWDIKIIPCSWGNTPNDFIENNPQWMWLKDYFLEGPLTYQPDYMIWGTIPEEAQRWGRYSSLITAGIESTACTAEWIQGCNRMDRVWVSSNHAKWVFENTKYEQRDQQGNKTGVLELTTGVDVIFEGGDLDVFHPIEKPTEDIFDLSNIPEKFIYLFSGIWSSGDMGHDRKNIGLTIKLFFETFKNTPNPPALLLKTSLGNSSYMNRDQILHRIKKIRKSVKADILPNIYLLNGDITDEQMNNLYNHPRIKAMISLHKGEGWGRGLFEFTLVNKPLIASGWSGSNDFLDPSLAILLPGKLENVHHSAANKWLIPQSQWFSVDPEVAMGAMREVYNNYKKYKTRAITQGYKNRTNYSYNKMKELVASNIEQNFPKFPVTEQIKMPTIKQIK